jgi:hypothetical protein
LNLLRYLDLRYLDLAKFVSLLQKKAIHFTRGNKFKDPFEGSYPLSAVNVFGGDSRVVIAVKNGKNLSPFHVGTTATLNQMRFGGYIHPIANQCIAIKTKWKKLKTVLGGQVNYLTCVKYIDFVKDDAEIITPFNV